MSHPSPRQYLPFSAQSGEVSLIVYPVLDENPLSEVYVTESEIREHLEKLYAQHEDVQKGEYHILFVWNLEGERMTDIWIHSLENWSDSGPLVECRTFRGLEPCEDAGIASGDSLICLGREEELRRSLGDLKAYVDRAAHLPVFPDGMQPTQRFGA